jgi:predicted metal-dependent enzyme (double-stranded beta helix superfamily)
MLNTKVLNNAPTFLTFNKPTNLINCMVHGQCVFLFNTTEECSFTFYTKDKSDGLKVSLTSNEFLVTRLKNSNKYESQTKKGGLSEKSGAYYWFSLDSQNQIFQAGVGEARIETECYTYKFDSSDKLWEANKAFLESLVCIELSDVITPIRLLKNPITASVPLLIKGMNDLTMDDVASNAYLPSASLSPAAQVLYQCVAGEKFVLNTPDFPDFSKAIEYSIATPGLWCNTRLAQKATEFGKDPQPLETYLRITLGQNNGQSPGIPYVMEIWPVGHYSPVHNHSGANAIIRVLHGSIHVSLFPYLCDESESVDPFATKDFKTGDITWISSTLNQVHQLKNLETNTETCITIQCYLYDETDKEHYDYFDYLGDKNAKNQYEPDSDMDFVDFKKLMQKEWNNRTTKKGILNIKRYKNLFG